MRIVLTIVALTAVAVFMAACGVEEPAGEVNQIEGPAMIVFYTDG